MRARLNRRRGFTLIETLVAFTILTLVLAQLLQGIGGAARNESRADFFLRASREGKSLLESVGVETAITPGVSTGRYNDGLIWRLAIEPVGRTSLATGGTSFTSYAVTLVISRPDYPGAANESLTLSTLKLVMIKEKLP